jgi:hypothetical protein
MLAFNLNALKAHVGGVLAANAVNVGPWVLELVEKTTTIDFPTQIDGLIVLGVNYAIGFIVVWLTPNIQVNK